MAEDEIKRFHSDLKKDSCPSTASPNSPSSPSDGNALSGSNRINTILEKKENPVAKSSTLDVPRSLDRTISYGDGHGALCVISSTDDRPPESVVVGGEESEEKRFEVGWDGPDDLMNPKNMATGRKWAVVFIVSMGSACV